MGGAAAHPMLRGFPANEPPQRLTPKLHQKQEQTDQVLAESTAVEFNSGYGVYEADLITYSIPDETAITSNSP